MMEHLPDFLLKSDPLHLFRVVNFFVAGFGALMLLRMKTETSTREQPWTTHLSIALLVFAVQYLVYVVGLRANTIWLFDGSNNLVWSEFFGLPINYFLLSAARMLLNRGRRLPRWFFVLVAIDLVAVIMSVASHLPVDDSHAVVPTLCRIPGDAMTFISLWYFGYASCINTRFFENRSGIALGIIIGIIYGGIHLVSPFISNIAAWYSSPLLSSKDISVRIGTVFTFVAALFKLALVYSAFLISTLENRTLIELRNKLRESVDARKVFFSRKGILEAIIQAFKADSVKLYIKVPPRGDGADERQVHLYWPSAAPNEYETVSESETPLPQLLARLTLKNGAGYKTQAGASSIWKKIGQRARRQPTPALFDGIEPIRYHGGLIGCLTLEKKGSRQFTYSAEKLCRVLSEDISALVQFYRVQESLRILSEALNKNLETLSATELNKEFEKIIQRVLSPLQTRFDINAGFVAGAGPTKANSGGVNDDARARKTVGYECVTDEPRGSLTIGHIYLDYQFERDPLTMPSLGYFIAYRNAVGSIVTRSFLSCVDQKLNLIIRNLSLELAKKLDFDKWFDQLQTSAREAELSGVVIFHPELRDFSQLIRGSETADNLAIGEALAAAFPNARQLLEYLGDSPRLVLRTPDRLILGMKLKFASDIAERSSAGLFVGVKRLEFAGELSSNTPWCNFLKDFANIAGYALERIIQAKQIQKSQIEQAEDYMVIETAEKVGLITHELLSHIENLANNAALLRLDLPESLDEDLKQPINLRIEEMREEFASLRSLTARIRNSAQIPDQSGPCSLQKTLQRLANLHESRSNIEIQLKGIKSPQAGSDSAEILSDIEVDLPQYIVELTFGNLIRNSIAAIKRRANDQGNGAGGSNGHGLIKIWTEVDEGEPLIDCFINDNGSGIPLEMMEKIFDANVSSTPGQGGWGLFYLKRKLERGPGSITLEHSEPGNTTFLVRLPRVLNKTS
jgi:signal transduction histidine kinase